MALVFLFLLTFLPFVVYCGYPISDPNASTIGNVPYNLIDTNPSCFYEGICPMFPPGGRLSAFPNSEEKFQHILHNMHRMFPNQSLDIVEGKWKFGGNKNGGRTEYCQLGCTYCGSWHEDRRPLYWYSDANQMARFKQWDENQCDQSWYDENGNTAHSTCKKGLSPVTMWGSGIESITGSNRCSLFGTVLNPKGINPQNPEPFNDDCEFGGRGSKFCHDQKDKCDFHSEGICGGNSCFWDPHCEPIFANFYDYVGKGFVAGMNGVAAVYSRFTEEIDYLLPIASHYDERLRMPADEMNQNGKTFALMLEYFDANKIQTPTDCYALYDGKFVSMNVYVSNHPYDGGKYKEENGFYDKDSFNVIFKQNYDVPTQCMPYAFICKTSQNEFVRLPEDADYYFGTEWIDWKWSNYKDWQGLECKENHYYYDGNEWIVNGGPKLDRCDIWYYHDADYSECIGCGEIAKLDCLSQCIYDGNEANCACDNVQPVSYGKQQCTSAPSFAPSNPPTFPTAFPSVSPTDNPMGDTPLPSTDKPTATPIFPSALPTNHPIDPSKAPTVWVETDAPTLSDDNATVTSDTDGSKRGPDVRKSNGGGVIAAYVMSGFIFVFCIFLIIYWKHETRKSSVKTEAELSQQISKSPSSGSSVGLPKLKGNDGGIVPMTSDSTNNGEGDYDMDNERTPLSSPSSTGHS